MTSLSSLDAVSGVGTLEVVSPPPPWPPVSLPVLSYTAFLLSPAFSVFFWLLDDLGSPGWEGACFCSPAGVQYLPLMGVWEAVLQLPCDFP